MNLSGKVAIVTGGSRGLGKAMAVELAREGAAVAVAARTEESGQSRLPGTIHQTVKEIEDLGGKAIPVKCDVTKEEDVHKMVRRVSKLLGPIDILINNAGIGMPKSFVKLTTKNWDLVINVNLRGTFLCTKAVLPQMMERRSGNIINLSSVLATQIKYSVVYGASKAAIERLTLGLAAEVKKYHIAVNALRPDFTATEAVVLELPNVDTSKWQKPEMWGKYAALVAAQDADSLTGRILDEPALKKIFGPVL
ncbi:MAG: SDR family NAD(P)-dependent oxidoreductase [Deltaproteobacteria bacterium]|nr:SDR family NAD(P)-dependent oxidoreductase [Deltaproteobacteria bacterium]